MRKETACSFGRNRDKKRVTPCSHNSPRQQAHMIRLCLATLALLIGLFVLPVSGMEDDVVPLFDGKTLGGWTFVVKPDKNGKKADPKDTWSVRDGIIICTGKPNGCAVTQKEFGDYILKLKWRFPAESKGGNSGVLLHVQDDKYWPTSVEAQLQSGALAISGSSIRRSANSRSIQSGKTPSKRAITSDSM